MSRTFAKTCVALALALLPIGTYGQTPHESAVSIASALRSQEFDRALEMLRPALQRAPRDPQLWMFQGLAYAGKGDARSAIHSYNSALKISPDYLPALEGAAQLQYEARDPAAIPLLQRVLRLRPEDATSHAMLGVLAYEKGECAAAVEHFAKSGTLLDTQSGALQEFGACLWKLKRTGEAVVVFQKLVNSNPGEERARRSLATLQLATGQTQDAIATLQPLLNTGADAKTLQLAATMYEANKDTPSAVRTLREAIVKEPQNTGLYVDFANLAMDHQSFQAGIEMIDSGLKVSPSAAELFLARGVLYVQMAEYDKAEADFERAEQLDPRQGLSAAAQGMVAEERNQSDPEQALATVRAKLAKKPGDAFLWYLQAAMLAQKAPEPGSAEFQQGLNSAKKAVTLQPSLTAAHNVLAKFYLDARQYPLAAAECRKVLEQSPQDQTALYHLVVALRKGDDQREVPELLQRLAKARQDATRAEGERNRYKLVVTPGTQP
jgi:tetratricopeptide (TPR) repeat protein